MATVQDADEDNLVQKLGNLLQRIERLEADRQSAGTEQPPEVKRAISWHRTRERPSGIATGWFSDLQKVRSGGSLRLGMCCAQT